MARPAPSELDVETVPVPGSVRFPVELTPPDIVVVPRAGTSRHRVGECLPADPRLPDLAPRVDELFAQLLAG